MVPRSDKLSPLFQGGGFFVFYTIEERGWFWVESDLGDLMSTKLITTKLYLNCPVIDRRATTMRRTMP
ncbi:MAG: hypothetical protein C0619_03880 [Desulfuromonas sp.]|nr:MAG: hypothetical protein C0619_03880 [Desulfuromonas sp.]